MSSNENQVNVDTSSQPEENVASLQTINNQFNIYRYCTYLYILTQYIDRKAILSTETRPATVN